MTKLKTYSKSEIDKLLIYRALRCRRNLRQKDFDSREVEYIKLYYGKFSNALKLLKINDIVKNSIKQQKKAEKTLKKYANTKFATKNKRNKITFKQEYSREEVIEIIQQQYNKNNGKIYASDFNKAFVKVYKREFGGWDEMLKELGLNKKSDYTKEELVEFVKNKTKELGRVPTAEEINIVNYRRNIKKFFDSYHDLLIECGYKKQRVIYSREELIKITQHKYKENKEKIHSSDFDKDFIRAYTKEFGSWEALMKSCGFERKSNYSKEDLIEIVKARTEELGRRPRVSELGISSYNAHIKKHFKNFNELLMQCGYEVYGEYFYTDKGRQQIKNRLLEFYHKNNKIPLTRDVKKIEGIPNQTIIKKTFNKESWREIIEDVLDLKN